MAVASSFAPCEWESRSWRVSTTVVRMGPSQGRVGAGKMAPRTLAGDQAVSLEYEFGWMGVKKVRNERWERGGRKVGGGKRVGLRRTWVKVEIASDLRVGEAASQEEKGALQTPAGDNGAFGVYDDLAGGFVVAADAAVGVSGSPDAFHTCSYFFAVDVLEEDFFGREALYEECACSFGVREERDDRALLLGGPTPERAIAAVMAVASRILRDGFDVVAQSASALQ